MSLKKNLEFHINKPVFYPSLILIILAIIPAVVFKDNVARALNATQLAITSNLGWFFIASVNFILVFILYIAFSKYGKTDQIIVHNQFGIEHAEAIYVSRVAWQFFPGPGPEELAKMVEDQSRARKERWKKEYPREKDLTVLSTTTESIATVISNYLTENQTDLVIMGVLGASSLTGLFMGSVTNEILSLPTSTTILLVKRQVTA